VRWRRDDHLRALLRVKRIALPASVISVSVHTVKSNVGTALARLTRRASSVSLRTVITMCDARLVRHSQTLIRPAEETSVHAQQALTAQLLKNAHPSGRGPAKSIARTGRRTSAFFGGRLKRLAFSSGYALRRGVERRRLISQPTVQAQTSTIQRRGVVA